MNVPTSGSAELDAIADRLAVRTRAAASLVAREMMAELDEKERYLLDLAFRRGLARGFGAGG